ncbi:MAG TPA: VOC family protein [Azonexus sp.]|nr:VOC family protein [Azonexus sp.]
MTAAALNLVRIKVLALAVTDFERAMRFYTETLSLPAAYEDGKPVGVGLGHTTLMFKSDSALPPSETLNPRVTIETADARGAEILLRQRGVTIADSVERYGSALVGSFLDSEGNKLWFCSQSPP